MSPARHAAPEPPPVAAPAKRAERAADPILTTHQAGAEVDCIGVVHVYRAAGTDIAALRGVDLHVGASTQMALLGPSGSGKSTLLTLLAGIRQPSAGQILIDGHDVARLPLQQQRAYRARTVGSLLQGAVNNLLPYASSQANVRKSQRTDGRPKLPAASLLDSLGLPKSQTHRPVSDLSPSQQQVTAMAVALANSPRLLVADEPTSQLDPAARDDILDSLLGVVAQTGTTVVIVTHDDNVAARMQRTLHLHAGRIGSEEQPSGRYPVLGSDGSVQLPTDLIKDWPAGIRLRIESLGPRAITITHVDDA